MRLQKKRLSKSLALLALTLFGGSAWADIPCLPCGEVITNAELPTSPGDCNRVAPFQNYIATAENCGITGSWNGFYIGTGVGFGNINYNLKIPNITLQQNGKSLSSFKNSYTTEFLSIGYSHAVGGFYIGAELGYYYDSTTSPLFYEDLSAVTLSRPGPPPVDVAIGTLNPTTVRLDINAHNHVALDLTPGFIFSNRLAIYGRVGVEYSGYSWQRRLAVPNVNVVAVAGVPLGLVVFDGELGDVETDSNADLRLGAGISFAVSSHVSFDLNYIHISGSKLTFTPDVGGLTALAPRVLDPFTGTIFDAVVTPNITTLAADQTLNPNRNELLVGVTFTF